MPNFHYICDNCLVQAIENVDETHIAGYNYFEGTLYFYKKKMLLMTFR